MPVNRETGLREIANCTRADFDQILRELADFWGNERTLALHHPMWFREFGNSAFVVREAETVVAYLFGFVAQTGPYGYVHLIAVRKSRRGRGLGRLLYERFTCFVQEHGCLEIRAITSPTNAESIAFHQSMGMEMLGSPNEDGIPVVEDYSGPGLHRVLFRKSI